MRRVVCVLSTLLIAIVRAIVRGLGEAEDCLCLTVNHKLAIRGRCQQFWAIMPFQLSRWSLVHSLQCNEQAATLIRPSLSCGDFLRHAPVRSFGGALSWPPNLDAVTSFHKFRSHLPGSLLLLWQRHAVMSLCVTAVCRGYHLILPVCASNGDSRLLQVLQSALNNILELMSASVYCLL